MEVSPGGTSCLVTQPRRYLNDVLSRRAAMLAFSWGAVGAASCGDPVRDDGIASLGPEQPGVRRGPTHRPGQPCLLCHDDGEATAFSVAGTVFADANSTAPVGGVAVYLIDATAAVFTVSTNC